MPQTITIQVNGLLELQQKLKQAPKKMARVLKDAAGLVGDTVLNTEGLRKYPPSTAANQPPPPYYERGKGMWVRAKGFRLVKKDSKKYQKLVAAGFEAGESYSRPGYGTFANVTNLGNSERLGTKFYAMGEVVGIGDTVTRIGNPVSYAPYVVGDEDQARAMARIGWRKLGEVAREKQDKIRAVFEAVIQAALNGFGL